MISQRPYLLRAIYQWSIDNGMTPQVLVDASYPGVIVPQSYIQHGHIVFNIHERAVQGLKMENDFIFFSARFGGQPHNIELPVLSIQGIYTRESNKGLFFQQEDNTNESTVDSESKSFDNLNNNPSDASVHLEVASSLDADLKKQANQKKKNDFSDKHKSTSTSLNDSLKKSSKSNQSTNKSNANKKRDSSKSGSHLKVIK